MATSPQQPDPERQLIALYAAVEAYLLQQSSRILTSTLTAGGILAAIPALKRLAQQTAAALAGRAGPLVQAMVARETAAGRAHADRTVAHLPPPPGGRGGSRGAGGAPPPPGGFTAAGRDDGEEFFDLSLDHGERAAAAIRRDLLSELEDVRFRITRLPDDIYKALAPQGGILQVLDNNLTPEQAQAAAWQAFTRSGVTGFTDRSGREWSLSAYTEMAVRTAAARAFNASSLARMQAIGFRYFTVPPHVHPCPLCLPWEGAILTVGPNPDPDVHTDGTVEEATARGLFHPNCRHPLIVWDYRTQPRPQRRGWTGEDDLRYRATQKQRALEREIRKAKAAAAHSLNPAAAAEARRDVRRAQAAIRAHLEKHPQLGRQSRREQPNLRMDVQDLTPWKPPPGPKPPYADGAAPDWRAAE